MILPAEVPPTAGEVSFQIPRGIRFGTRHARRSAKQLPTQMSAKGFYSKNCNIGSPTRCIRWPAHLRSQWSKIDSAPAEAGSILERVMRRITLLSDMHRCLNNPTLFDKGFSSILSDAVATAIDSHSTYISFQVDELGLSFDQMSIITMIVIEVANNAQKHVFGRNLGAHFLVSFRAVSDNRAALSVKDDGPGWSIDDAIYAGRTLGLTVLEGLTDQLHGTLHITSKKGTETSVIFPLSTQGPLCQGQIRSVRQQIRGSSPRASRSVAFRTGAERPGATGTIWPPPA